METDLHGLEASWNDGPEYVDAADVARLIRKRLKVEFPGVKFRVRTDKYSMGASVRIRWTDGPTTTQVRRITDAYAGGGFDGMIDLAYDKLSWLMPDGSAAFAHTTGTEGSRGTVPAHDESRPHPDAKLVHFLADHVFADRDLTAEFLARLESEIPINVEGYERDQWVWRTSQRFELRGDELVEHRA